MRQRNAEILFFCRKPMGRSFSLPWIGYIADLQHKHLPNCFRRVERWHRDIRMAAMLDAAPALIVNAAAVIRDIEEFFPGRQARLYSMPFCPPADPQRLSGICDLKIRTDYHMPARYFMISNQFWIHKSHETAFKALRMVRDCGYDFHLVCTGDTTDYRWPKHFGNLLDLISKLGLKDYIHILGLIPKTDQLAIMRGAMSVIQPTLFEGGPGGGSVYDAISTGTPALVSDIPVNREIDLGTVDFFTAADSEELGKKMIDWILNPPRRPSGEETLAQLRSRQKELGSLLLKIAVDVAGSHFAARGVA